MEFLESRVQLKPRELSIGAVDVSVSDMTDGASLDRLPQLLGALPDCDEDEYTIREEMRFALRDSQEAVLRQTTSVDVDDKSTVSSLTYDLHPSFDELHKSYVRKDLEPTAYNIALKNAIGTENPSVTQSMSANEVSPWKRWFHLSKENSKRAQSCIAVFDVSKKTLVVAAVVMLLALIAITASSSAISRGNHAVDSEAAKPGDERVVPESIHTGVYPSKQNETGPTSRPASKSSKENAILATAQSSDLGEIADVTITSKSDGSALNNFNSSSHEGVFEDDYFQSGTNSSDVPSYESIQSPASPSNYPTTSVETEATVLFDTQLFDSPTYYPSHDKILIETRAPSRTNRYTDEPTLISTR